MNGIAVAGSLLVDVINRIESYPNEGQLTKIVGRTVATGGLVPNVGIDLKRLERDLVVYAIGKVGADDNGKFAIHTLKENGLNVDLVKVSNGVGTSFTDVMSVSGGQRTFFCYAGACADFGYDDIDFDKLDVKMFHLGYFLLLDKVDGGDGVRILKKCVEKGIKTSIDLVSEHSNRYRFVVPCLPYVDNLIVNEEEASRLANIDFNGDNLEEIARVLKGLGVRERVIVHMPKKSVCLSDRGYTEIDSFTLPNGFIKGTTGAGDAFCAGALLGIYNEFSDEDILKTGMVASLGALSGEDAVSGMKSFQELKKIAKEL